MDVTAIGRKGLALPAQGQDSAALGLAVAGTAASFLELMRNTTVHVDGDLAQMIERNVLSRPSDRGAPPPRDDRPAADRAVPDRSQRSRSSAGNGRNDDRRSDTRQIDRAGNAASQAGDRNGVDAPSAASRRDDSHTPRSDASGENQGSDAAIASDAGSDDDSVLTLTGDSTAAGILAAAPVAPGAITAQMDPTQAVADATHGRDQAVSVLSNLLQRAQGSFAAAGEAPAQASGQAAQGPGEQAVPGLTNALAQVANAGHGAERALTHGLTPQAPTGAGVPDNIGVPQGPDPTALAISSQAQQQAIALGRAIGQGNRVSIQISGGDEAATFVSQPRFALAPTSVLAVDGAQNTAGAQQGGRGNVANADAQGSGPAMAGALAAVADAARIAASENAGMASGLTREGSVSASGGAQTSPANPTGQVAGGPTAAPAELAGGPRETRPANAPAPAQHQQPAAHARAVADQISVQISRALAAGMDRITIQLKPESLGRVEVKLELAPDGRVTAVVTADNKNTLDLLQQDSRGLEQALRDAGLNADSGSLSYNLRGHNPEARDLPLAGSIAGAEDASEVVDEPGLNELLAGTYEGGVGADGRVDIRA